MLMKAFDDEGRYILRAFIIIQAGESGILGYMVSENGRPRERFWTDSFSMMKAQQQLKFRILNRSGQCLPLLGDNT